MAAEDEAELATLKKEVEEKAKAEAKPKKSKAKKSVKKNADKK